MGNILHSKHSNIASLLIFLYLALFPLGQLPRLVLELSGLPGVHFTDGVIVALLVVSPVILKYPLFRVMVATLVAFTVFSFVLVPGFVSILYVIRLCAYINLGFVVFDFARKRNNQKILLQSLALISVVSALLGIVQYLTVADVRTLKTIGWDDHYLRLVGTFLDPAFTGILLVFGILLTVVRRQQIFGTHRYWFYFALSLEGVALLLTYSRASFLALGGALLVLAFKHLQARVGIVVLIGGILLLPQSHASEGVNLARTASAMQKYQNSLVARRIIQSSPVFGVGMNLCPVKESLFAITRSEHLHDCAGLENSVLYAFAVWGVAGVWALLGISVPYIKKALQDEYMRALLVALTIHLQFTNTLFYAWVMGWIAISAGVVARELTAKK